MLPPPPTAAPPIVICVPPPSPPPPTVPLLKLLSLRRAADALLGRLERREPDEAVDDGVLAVPGGTAETPFRLAEVVDDVAEPGVF